MAQHGSTPGPHSPTAGGHPARPTDGGAPTYLSHRAIIQVMIGLMAGVFLAALDQSIVGTALPRIVSDLGGLDHLSWVVTAYLLTSTASTPLWGKISDLYGRRPMFQAAICTFLVGSLLAGAAQNMPVLIGGRAVQGLGGGGLMALALAIIGDIIPPRERGRYQGFFGAVFGVSSVAGPLLGGFFTDGPGWRWIFWLNVPISLLALYITSRALTVPRVRREHTIDYLGAALVVGSVSSILLYTSWAGTEFGWADPVSLALLGAGAVLALLFVAAERRAAEPIIPLRLFSLRVFSTASLFAFTMGMAMFAGIIYLPFYLQVVRGYSPTGSGLAMFPMVVGMFTTSIGAGIRITRTGRYKRYPIIGAALATVAIALLSTITVDIAYWQVACYMLILGAGLGLTMQTIMTAVQNAVELSDMGTATSAVTFFRSMGGAFGTAVCGAVLANRLPIHLESVLPGAAAHMPPGALSNVQAIASLPAQVKAPVLTAFVDSLQDLFITTLPFVVIALAISFAIPETPLRTRNGDAPAPLHSME